jgi:hypothetical protein
MRCIELTCAHCEQSFNKELRKYKYELKIEPTKKFYCSRECHTNANRKAEAIICETCQKVFTRLKDKRAKHHFCSQACSAQFTNKNRAINGYTTKDKTKETVCYECNAKVNIALNASSKIALCDACRSKHFTSSLNKNGLSKKSKSKKLHQLKCISCSVDIVGDSKKKYCDDCRSKRLREIGRKAGTASAAKQVRRSKNEMYFAELCAKAFINVVVNEAIFTSKYGNWDADVIIHDHKIAVLWNGIWHYKQVRKKHSLAQVQSRDKIKMDVIIANGYTPYVIKDMGKHNKKFVEERFAEFMEYVRKLNDIK